MRREICHALSPICHTDVENTRSAIAPASLKLGAEQAYLQVVYPWSIFTFLQHVIFNPFQAALDLMSFLFCAGRSVLQNLNQACLNPDAATLQVSYVTWE